mmetsp:Transcript_38386/g.91033  ORF Transcript_38386/g.91033 Transcript_38386/m.91033 type:complete len:447 (+) Transcript_38386:1315-2655(+)
MLWHPEMPEAAPQGYEIALDTEGSARPSGTSRGEEGAAGAPCRGGGADQGAGGPGERAPAGGAAAPPPARRLQVAAPRRARADPEGAAAAPHRDDPPQGPQQQPAAAAPAVRQGGADAQQGRRCPRPHPPAAAAALPEGHVTRGQRRRRANGSAAEAGAPRAPPRRPRRAHGQQGRDAAGGRGRARARRRRQPAARELCRRRPEPEGGRARARGRRRLLPARDGGHGGRVAGRLRGRVERTLRRGRDGPGLRGGSGPPPRALGQGTRPLPLPPRGRRRLCGSDPLREPSAPDGRRPAGGALPQVAADRGGARWPAWRLRRPAETTGSPRGLGQRGARFSPGDGGERVPGKGGGAPRDRPCARPRGRQPRGPSRGHTPRASGWPGARGAGRRRRGLAKGLPPAARRHGRRVPRLASGQVRRRRGAAERAAGAQAEALAPSPGDAAHV